MTGLHAASTTAFRLRGFTLIEMLVTVTIVGLLSTVAFPLLELAQRRSDERDMRDALRQIRNALDAYKQAYDDGRILLETSATGAAAAKPSGYPANLEILVSGVSDAKSPNRSQRIYFLRRIPVDPFAPVDRDGPRSANGGWGVRSYASPPGDMRDGADVFDVYSRSPLVGLNGMPYREW
jgi:general secretion pathway protein G